MNNKTIAILSGLFVAAVIGLFVIVNLSSTDTGNDTDATDQTATTAGEEMDAGQDQYPGIERITAKHFFADGTHTFVGEIPMPTPCDLLETSAQVRESMPEQVVLEFSVINESDMCAQVITPQRFMIEVQASEEATVSAEFMGRTVELNLLEPAPGETPDDFELYIKG